MIDAVRLDDALGVFVVRYAGPVGLSDIRDAYSRMTGDPAFRPGLSAICDMRDAELKLSGDDVRLMAALVRAASSTWGEAKWLALVGSDVSYGMMRMFISMTDGCPITTMVVREPAAADTWFGLGVPVATVLDGRTGSPLPAPRRPAAR